MKTWGIILSLLTMAGCVGVMVHALRSFRPSSAQTLAGAVASFQLGTLALLSLTIPSFWALSVVQVVLIVGTIEFFGLEIYLGRKQRYTNARRSPGGEAMTAVHARGARRRSTW